MELKPCPECGAPEIITHEHLWLNNGDIVQARAQTSRILFSETENMDPLFRGISKIIGTDIENMVITAGRRAYRVYLSAFVPKETREKIKKKELDYKPIVESFFYIGQLNGVGSYDFVKMRYEQDEQDYAIIRITEPYSVPMAVAAHIGAIECVTGVDHGYTYEKTSPGVYEITAFPSPHLKGLSKRLWFEPYHHPEGDMELEKCGTCGGPNVLSLYGWYPDRGVVENKTTKRRMAILGNALLDPVFEELEQELGDTIPRAVVEAQRRFTRSGFYTMEDITNEGDFRTQLALRGMGNLKELVMRRKGMRMRLENVALPYIATGISQGFFEMGFDLDTMVDWELSEEGDLQVEVKPMMFTGTSDPSPSISR